MSRLSTGVTRIADSPAAVLFLLSPVVAELLSSSSPLPEFLVAWLPLAALYGCGALLIREARVRWALAWPAVFLLGAAYGIVEEGIVVRSFFDPLWEDLDLLAVYGRAGGVNWTWSHLLTLFHASMSIAAPILAVELAFPERRRESWIGRRGTIWCAVGVLGWMALGDAAFMDASGGQLLGAVLAAAALSGLAFRFRRAEIEIETVPPRPKRYFWLAFLTGFVTFVIPHAAAEGGSVHAVWPSIGITVVPAVAAALWDRWSRRGTAWTDADRSSLFGGAIGWLALLVALTANPVGIATSGAAMVLWWRWHRSVGDRAAAAMVEI